MTTDLQAPVPNAVPNAAAVPTIPGDPGVTPGRRPPDQQGPPDEQGRQWTPRLWGILAVLCAVLFLDALDVSMVGVALPSIGSELGLSTTSLQWIVNGYVLGY